MAEESLKVLYLAENINKLTNYMLHSGSLHKKKNQPKLTS